MDEITLITDYLKELVGYDVNVIWGAGKDDSLGDELRVAVIATGFNGVPVDTKRSPISFKVEEVEDLELKVVDPKKLEEEERQRKQKQEENRMRRLQRERQRKEIETREKEEEDDLEEESREKRHPDRDRKRGINEVPDVDSWFKRKLGTMFSEDMSRDTEL